MKLNDESELVYLGRFDHQVKVNGYRIKLGEIHAELKKQAGVSGAVVMVHEEQLIAYVTSDFVAGHGHKDHDLKVRGYEGCARK